MGAFMRRRFQRFLPVILIALVVQILAPIAASWAATAAISDPLGAAEICHNDSTSQTSPGDPGADHGAVSGTCCIYCAAQANASFDAPRLLALVLPYRPPALVAWREHVPELRALRPGSNAQARAPPAIS